MQNIKLIKLFDIQVEIHPSWFIIFILIGWTLATAYFPYVYPDIDKAIYWVMGVVAALLLFLSVLLHEFMHSIVAKRNGLPIRKITLFIFGGIAHMSDEAPNAKTELKMAIAGPLCSITLMFIFGILAYFLKDKHIIQPLYAVLRYLSIINGVLAVFNLIPGFPLDGGRILRSTIWFFTGNLKKATFIASTIGKIFAVLLIVFGFLNMLFLQNFIGGLWLIFIGFFLYQAANMGYMQVSLKNALTGIHVKDVMIEDVITVSSDDSLEYIVNNYFFRYRYGGFPVVSNGEVIGLITLNRVKEIDKNKWSELKVSEVMDKDIDRMKVYQDEEAVSVVNKVIREDIGRVIVVDENLRLKGILTRKDILSILKFRTDLGI